MGSTPTDEAHHLSKTQGSNGQSQGIRRGHSNGHPSSRLGGQSGGGTYSQHYDHMLTGSHEGVTSNTSSDAQTGHLDRITIFPSAVNRFADRISRLHSLDDLRIKTRSIRAPLHEMEPKIDRFVDHESTICTQFNSLYRSPGSSAIDSLQKHWGQTVKFRNPPLKLIPLVVEKIVQESATSLLVTPWWPAQSWCRRLKEIGTFQSFHAPDVYLPPL